MNDVLIEEQFVPSLILYSAKFTPAEEGGFVITFRDIPEAISQGDDFDDALEMAIDALATAMEFYFEDNRRVPAPSLPEHGEVAIALSQKNAVLVQAHNAVIKRA